MGARKNPERKPRKAAKLQEAQPEQCIARSEKANWTVYKHLHKQAIDAWEKLKHDVTQKAAPEVLIQDRDNLLLLLGECNYIAGECMRLDHGHSQS